ncbi:hypothetical protein [Nostoc sp. PCC 9305]|uniref:hypothetical protein n=1 Tax=Nostoc sp. PCC 9305 TaxID=296636 RepID=UPI0039C6B598
MTNLTKLLRSREIPFNYEIDWNNSQYGLVKARDAINRRLYNNLLWLEPSFLMQR